MKTKEFIKRVEDMGFEVHTEKNMTYVNKNLENLSYIDEEYTNTINTVLRTFARLEDKKREKLFKAIVEYASTPIEERKSLKKYRLTFKHVYPYCMNLMIDNGGNWILREGYDNSLRKEFTLEELPDWVHEMLEQGHFGKQEVK